MSEKNKIIRLVQARQALNMPTTAIYLGHENYMRLKEELLEMCASPKMRQSFYGAPIYIVDEDEHLAIL